MVIRTASIPRVAALHTLESMRDVDPAEVPIRGYLGRFRTVKRSIIVRPILAALLLLGASPLAADCIANGHYTLAASAFPYTEDLTRPASEPLHDGMWAGTTDDWTLIQTACSERTNVNASVDVTLLVRASFHIGKTTAAPDAIFDVQLRVDGEPITTQSRRVGDQFPKSFRFGASVQKLPAGNHLLTMWLRMRNPGAIYVGLQWITAQGIPANDAGSRVLADKAGLGNEWTMIGPPLLVSSMRDIDAAMQASLTIVSAGAPLWFEWTLDGERPGTRSGMVAAPLMQPDGVMLFDHRGSIDRGSHFVQLWGRSDRAAELEGIAIDLVGFPHELAQTKLIPLAETSADTPILATTAGDPQQPLAMSSDCGRWTKILEFDMPQARKDFSWSVDGFVEVLGYDVSGYGVVGIEVDSASQQTDVGMFEMQIDQQHDGFYFYGDCSKWSPGDATHVSLWIRRIEGCGVAPLGGSFTVGKRWLAVKLLPSQTPHLP